MAGARRPLFINPNAGTLNADCALSADIRTLMDKFHSQFLGGPSRLVPLAELARDIGVKAVFVKDESTRYGMSSFKILGASWATFRAVTSLLNLPLDTELAAVTKRTAGNHSVDLYAASEGNHGRAVARMAALLGVSVEIHVPSDMHASTIRHLQHEGAKVRVNIGTYDDAIKTARAAAEAKGGLFVQDCALEGYDEIPRVRTSAIESTTSRLIETTNGVQWIVEGYMSMFEEVDTQLNGTTASLVIAPVGVGSLAQAAVSHYKQDNLKTAVMTVEPDTAACLYKSLCASESRTIQTYSTIMAGLDCATLSTSAWPLLHRGIDASLTVSDFEAHQAAEYLHSQGIFAGPCGASPVAALRRLTDADKISLGLNQDSVVVLLCTEGMTEYRSPLDVSMDDAVTVTQTLVRIDSSNPNLGSAPGPGETQIAAYIASWLEHRDIETHWIEPTKGRPSIVGVVRGTGGGKSLMLNGHIDTVTTAGYEQDALGGEIKGGRLYGRGAQDMKAGIAAAMSALAAAKVERVRGDIILAAVSDEEAASIGTEQVLAAGWRADAAIVSEPTNEDIVHAHKGFLWLQVQVHGLASHGSMSLVGIDAITSAGHFLVELDKYSKGLARGWDDPLMAPSVHASIIKGGEEESSYPALCTIMVERRTVAGETADSVLTEFQGMLHHLGQTVSDFKGDVRITFERSPFNIQPEHPFALSVAKAVSQVLGREATFDKGPYWTDCALLSEKGIPVLLWGPVGDGLHSKEEWVDVTSLERVAKGLKLLVKEFCA